MELAAAGVRTRGRRSLPARRCCVATGEARVLDANARHTRHHSRRPAFGIHQFGWTREQATSHLRDRAPLAEHEITTEIDRYIAWPGQALAYKLGELQIRRHRREAEEKLGARFDQRRFHDAILAIGSVPLPVLEERMKRFIAEESAAPKQ